MSLYSPQGWIFIHVRKTGGTTMRNLLLGPLVRYLGGPHDSANSVRYHMAGQKAEGIWNMAFKFAFVRDPYTWVESMRRHAIAQHDHPLRDLAMGNVSDWPKILHDACRDRMPTTDGRLMFQMDMVFGDGRLLLDRLCRFENYVDEVKYITMLLGYAYDPSVHVGLTDIFTAPIAGEYREGIAHYFAHDFETLEYTK